MLPFVFLFLLSTLVYGKEPDDCSLFNGHAPVIEKGIGSAMTSMTVAESYFLTLHRSGHSFAELEGSLAVPRGSLERSLFDSLYLGTPLDVPMVSGLASVLHYDVDEFLRREQTVERVITPRDRYVLCRKRSRISVDKLAALSGVRPGVLLVLEKRSKPYKVDNQRAQALAPIIGCSAQDLIGFEPAQKHSRCLNTSFRRRSAPIPSHDTSVHGQLRAMRLKLGLSLDEVGQLTGISRSQMAHLEYGNRRLRPKHLQGFQKVYDIPKDQLDALLTQLQALPKRRQVGRRSSGVTFFADLQKIYQASPSQALAILAKSEPPLPAIATVVRGERSRRRLSQAQWTFPSLLMAYIDRECWMEQELAEEIGRAPRWGEQLVAGKTLPKVKELAKIRNILYLSDQEVLNLIAASLAVAPN